MKMKVIAIWIIDIWLASLSYCLKRLIFGVEQSYEIQVYGGFYFVLFLLTAMAYALTCMAI